MRCRLPFLTRTRIWLGVAGIGLVWGAARAAAEDAFLLRPGVPVFLSAEEPEALHLAVEDLRRDLESRFGQASPLAHDWEEAEGLAAIVILGPASAEEGAWEVRTRGHEAHRVSLRTRPSGGRFLVAEGADTRGAIYAVYTLSEEILGVPPMWAWASWEAELVDSIAVADDLSLDYAEPAVRWRGWFPNDQDYLEPWKDRDPRHRELLAETMLRLKLNCWDTGSVIGPPLRGLTADATVAGRRGLAVMATHTSPLGTGIEPGRWDTFWSRIRETETPPLESGAEENLQSYWGHVMDLVLESGVETIWTLTFRAHRDLPFWQLYGDAPESDVERAALISRFIRLQKEMVEERAGPEAWMRIPLYNEMSDYAIAGLMDLPEGERVIWNYVAARRDHYPPEGLEESGIPENQPLGWYYNIQFTSTGSHVVAGEGPWKMEENFRFVDGLQPRPLEFSLVNSGNTREFVLELSAHARMMWDFSGYTSDRFLAEFCRTYFGEEHAAEAAELTREYFHAYWEQHPPTRAGFERQFIFHDLRYGRAMRDLLTVLEKGEQTLEPLRQKEFFMIDPARAGAETTLEAILVGTETSGRAFAGVAARADRLRDGLPERNRGFFNDSLRVPAHFMAEINLVLRALAKAVEAAPESAERRGRIREARAAYTRAREFLAETEHGLFSPWHPRPGERDLFHLNPLETRLRDLDDAGP